MTPPATVSVVGPAAARPAAPPPPFLPPVGPPRNPAAAAVPEMPARPVDPGGPSLGAARTSFSATMAATAGASPQPSAAASGGANVSTNAAAGTLNGQALPPAAERFTAAIEQAAADAGLEPELFAALVWTESMFDPEAVSAAGAIGLAQLMPGTARHLGVDPHDPEQNLQGGARYLREQLDAFGSVELALAAYNAGPAAVRRHDGVPPFAETRAYVPAVLERFEQLR